MLFLVFLRFTIFILTYEKAEGLIGTNKDRDIVIQFVFDMPLNVFRYAYGEQ